MISYNNSAPKAVNNVGQFGATEGSIGAYKSAAEYAADAKYWALLSQTKYSSVEEILAEVERLYAQGRLLEEDIKQLKVDFETQQQVLLGLIQSTNTAIDNTNAATELSKEATQAVLAQLDIISNMTVQTTLLPPGSMATGSYDNTTGVFVFGIPEGQPGRDGTDGTISDIGSVAVGVPVSDDYGFYVDKDNGGLYRSSMVDIANLVPSIRSISINGGEVQTGAVSFNSVSSFNSRTGDIVSQAGDYEVSQITGAAKSGANSDITSLSGLTTALSVTQGGTGSTTPEGSRTNLGLGSVAVESIVPISKGGTGAASASAARTSLGLGSVSTESIVPITKGGTGSISAENARLALVAAKSGVNSDITSMTNRVVFTQPVAVADAISSTDAVNLGQLSSDQGASLIGVGFGKSLKDYLQESPSLSAVKYMTFAEHAALLAGNLTVNHQPAVQQVMDEAHNLKCSVYFPTGTYCFDTAVDVWSYVKAIWGDGSAVITRRYRTYFAAGSTSDIDPTRDTRKLFRILNGAVGRTLVYGLEFDGNARSIEVSASGQYVTTGIPDQTYYGDLEPGGTSPYIHGPDGNTFVDGENYFTHTKKLSGTIVSQCVFRDAPGSHVAGNMRNITITGNEFHGWYDHAVYAAGSAFADAGNGILVGDITVTGNTFRNRINTRGNIAVKGRFGFNRYTVTGNTFDCIDGCMAFDTGHGIVNGAYVHQPWGQITVTGNTANTSGMFMMISNNAGTKWFDTGWLSALTVTGNTVQSSDRIFLLGVSGGSEDYVMDGYSVNISNNIFLAPAFMTLYTFVKNSDWIISNNTINITGDAMIIGTDTANNSNSTLKLINNNLGRLLTTSTANLHVSSFERVIMRGNEIRNCSLSFGSYSTEITMTDNDYRWANGLPATRIFGAMYSNAGNGLNKVKLNRNTFNGSPTRFNIKCSSNCYLEIIGNDFGTINSYFLDISNSGYTPRIMRVNGNTVRGGRLVSGLPAGTALVGSSNYMELMNNFISSPTPGTQATATLFADDNAQSWLSHYQTIRCVKNTFRDALNGVLVSGTASSSVSNVSNKFWFGENATLNSTVTCNYPAVNKVNTDVTQTLSI